MTFEVVNRWGFSIPKTKEPIRFLHLTLKNKLVIAKICFFKGFLSADERKNHIVLINPGVLLKDNIP